MPSLNAMRAFEAASRLGSFAAAAEELLVTPGAIAAQIKVLEAECGAALFERHVRGVTLTSLGHRVMPHFSKAFDALGDAARELRRLSTPRKVHIVTSPALAQLWLAPRLARLRTILEDVDVSVTAIEAPPDLKRTPFDICLFYAAGGGDRLSLCEEQVFPVCTADLAKRIGSADDLAAVNCIADVVWEDWQIWTKGAGLERFAPTGPGFSLYSVAVQAALAGAGVLMGRKALIQPCLDSGALVAPLPERVALGLDITLWTLPESRHDRAVNAVVKTLRTMAEGTDLY